MSSLAERAKYPAVALSVLTKAGVVRPHGPRALAGVVRGLKDWGVGLAGGFVSTAARFPDRVGIIDERGPLTFGEIDRRGNALADALSGRGVGSGDSVAVLVRNHRGFLDISLACAKLGADVLYLNTAFAAPQLGEVCEREQPSALVFDEEFAGLVDQAGIEVPHVLAWVEDGSTSALPTLDDLIAAGDPAPRTPGPHKSRPVILTSGTTGTPKGAPRGGSNIGAAVSMLSRMPLHSDWTCHVAAPLFHTWGWAHLQLAMLLGNTTVLTRRFDPEECLRIVEEHRCDSLVVIPVMLQRILKLDDAVLDAHPMRSLRVVAASGSALPGDLATDWMDRFGDTLFNIYGSTEVAWVSIARPEDMRAAPGTAGKPPIGTEVRLYDDADRPVEVGGTGRIFVGNSMLFEGYTGGGDKVRIDGLMSTGDVGRFDDAGRLFVEGRDDEMIVSGGENVFPKEVEDVLSRHSAVHEVAAIGVSDDDFGHRLRAFVVLEDGASVDADDLREHVKANLARYKVPRDIVFIDELPRNATGKILKRELKHHDEEDE